MLITLPERKRLRKPGYNYSFPGPYYVTVCTFEREPFFDNEMNREIVNTIWESLPEHHNVRLDGFVVMPEHIHLILWIYNAEIENEGNGHPYFNRGRFLQTTPAPQAGYTRESPTPVTENFQINDKTKTNVSGRRVMACLDPSNAIPAIHNYLYKSKTLGAIVGSFKSAISKRIHNAGHWEFEWQRSFYDRIVRNNYELNLFREYIIHNPEILKEELVE